MIFFGEKMFRHAVQEYVRLYHVERNHQGLENQLIQPDESSRHNQRRVRMP